MSLWRLTRGGLDFADIHNNLDRDTGLYNIEFREILRSELVQRWVQRSTTAQPGQ